MILKMTCLWFVVAIAIALFTLASGPWYPEYASAMTTAGFCLLVADIAMAVQVMSNLDFEHNMKWERDRAVTKLYEAERIQRNADDLFQRSQEKVAHLEGQLEGRKQKSKRRR